MGAMKRALIFSAFVLAHAVIAREVPFNDVLLNPARFNKQHVTITGIAEVVGDDFYLWGDVAARQRFEPKTSIFVLQNFSLPRYPGTNISRYSPANFRWTEVTGVVNTNFHGRFGELPFGLMLERVQILPGLRLKQFLDIIVWFKNDTSHELKMDVRSKPIERVFDISPGEVSSTEIDVDQRATGELTLSNKRFATWKMNPALSKRFYDAEKRAYYCRITEGKVALVFPFEARGWKFSPTPERD